MFRVGDYVIYYGSWGQAKPRRCWITSIGADRGRPVYSNSLGQWGYEHQYERAPVESA